MSSLLKKIGATHISYGYQNLMIQKASSSYATGFWKIIQIVTLERPLRLFYFTGPANGYTRTLYIHSAIIRLG